MNTQWHARWVVLLRKTLRVETPTALEQLLATLTQPRQCHVLAFVNAHAMNSAADSQAFHDALACADTLLRDGSGMSILYRLLGLPPGLNLNGTDLIPKIIERFKGRPIALYGTQEPYLSNAAQVIAANLASTSPIDIANGFSDADFYISQALQHKPELIVLGMGMPKQELVASQLRSRLEHPCLIVCGGAILDFLGGKTQRAPGLLRTLGVEWIFRLMLEPRRLFKRYVLGNPLFLLRCVAVKARHRHAHF